MRILEAKLEGSDLSLAVKTSRLDALNAAEFKKDCNELWRNGIFTVSVDLSQVQFIDSSGVGALLSLFKRLPSANPTVRLNCVQPPVRAVIELLRLHQIFEVET